MGKKISRSVVLVSGLLVSGLAMAADAPATPAAPPAAAAPAAPPLPPASAAMLGSHCTGCHGTNGVSAGPASPTIAGITEEFFVETMQAFKAGRDTATGADRHHDARRGRGSILAPRRVPGPACRPARSRRGACRRSRQARIQTTSSPRRTVPLSIRPATMRRSSPWAVNL